MFVVSDYAGHYAPMVPLGRALEAAGHEVRLVCGPAHGPAAALTGLPVVMTPAGTDVDTVESARFGRWHAAMEAGVAPAPALLHPVTGEPMAVLDPAAWEDFAPGYFARTGERGRQRTRAFAAFAREWQPDLVVYDLLSAEGLVAAHVSGAVAVCHLWGPTGTAETGYGLAALRPDIPAPLRVILGIEAGADLVTHVIDPCPAGIAPATDAVRLPVRYTPFPGADDEDREWPDPWASRTPAVGTSQPAWRRPRVAVVWSTSLSRIYGPASFAVPMIAEAADSLGTDVAVAVDDQDALLLADRPLPDGVRLLGRYPLDRLLWHADVVVHHGGAGCVMTAIAAGVPQLALPFGAEQESIARRVEAAGAGRVVPGPSADVDSVRDALAWLVDDFASVAAARDLAVAHASTPCPTELVGTLVDLVASRRGVTSPAPGFSNVGSSTSVVSTFSPVLVAGA
jgi:UDP:flavonoid glycosyltransferase YjiC (YdhE family)